MMNLPYLLILETLGRDMCCIQNEKSQGRDWWEGRGPSVAEYRGPHPSQVRRDGENGVMMVR